MKIKNLISVAAFAFIGGCLRYLLTWWSNNGLGILIANWLGCFLLSLLTYYVIEQDLLAGWLDLGLGTGLIGAFTTFSSFATTVVKLGAADWRTGLVYCLASLVGGLVLALAGYQLAQWLTKKDVKDQ